MTTTVHHLYSALNKQGLTRRKLAHILPDWWTEEIESTPSGAQQAKIYLAKALSLRIRPFSETPPRVEFELPDIKRFKLSAKTTEADISLAVALARSASRIAISALNIPFKSLPSSAAEIRSQILGQGNSWVGLTQLVDFCWSHGIPVVHLATPLLGKKMDGIAMSINGHPSIVLSNKRKIGFLLFHLAHELGHIALGHLADNGVILDEDINEGSDSQEGSSQEDAADRFAIELLNGSAGGSVILQPPYPKAPKLAEQAEKYGRLRAIDPTHVVLGCAYNNKSIFGLCVAAANIIGGAKSDQETITDILLDKVSDELSSDNEHLLRNLIA